MVTVEDTAELSLNHPHVVRLEARQGGFDGSGAVTIRELIRNNLRMRPDRVVVGEVRGAEVMDMLQAMNTGHEGSMATIHANSPRECLYRIEMLAGFAGFRVARTACVARSPARWISSCRSGACPTASGACCR